MGWVQQLFTRRRRYDELSQSIQEHLEEKIADLVDSDMPREEAERTARREFGNVTLVEQHSREVWQWPTLESILADLRFALRQFRKAPGFAVTAILVVALGIAASVTIFTFVNAALLKPLPYQAPSRLVAVFEHTTDCPECAISYPDYQDWKSANTAFQSFEIWAMNAYLWRSAAGVESLRAGRVSGGFFQTLGVTPMLGRLFTAADDTPGAARAVVWAERAGVRALGRLVCAPSWLVCGASVPIPRFRITDRMIHGPLTRRLVLDPPHVVTGKLKTRSLGRLVCGARPAGVRC